jgi:hypothetical protein
MRIIPSFVRKEEEEMPPLPETAMIPRKVVEPRPTPLPSAPDFSEHDRKRLVMQEAAVAHDEYMRERAIMQESIDAAKGDKREIEFLKIENASLHNEIQQLQTKVEEFNKFHSVMCGYWQRWSIKPPEKKKRVQRAKKKEPAAETKANEQ